MLAHHRRGTGEPLVLLHGIGSQWQVWEPVLDALARERDVIAVDLPGFGGSAPLPAGVEPSAAALAYVVAAFLESLGVGARHVAGSSLGGWIALELARTGRARSVTGLSPAGFWNDREREYARLSLRASVKALRALSPALPALLASGAGRTALLSQLAARPWRMPRDAALGAARNLARSPGFEPTLQASMVGRFERGAQLSVPVTIAWGQRDRLLLPRQARRALRALPDARGITLTGCGHVPTWDDPDQVARVLLDGSRA